MGMHQPFGKSHDLYIEDFFTSGLHLRVRGDKRMRIYIAF